MQKKKWVAFCALGCVVLSHGTLGAEVEQKLLKKATFGAGCFWGVEKIFSKIPGVVSTAVGYLGGTTKGPTYEEVCTNRTGHAEVVEVTYDPATVSYEELLTTFWEYHDPTTPNRQGPDVGSQYRSVIFFYDQDQKKVADHSKKVLEEAKIFNGPVVTQILPATEFYRAEEYHQKYLQKNPGGYCSHHLQSPKIREIFNTQRSRNKT